jgi:peptidyl-Lys metalloendopeptidase
MSTPHERDCVRSVRARDRKPESRSVLLLAVGVGATAMGCGGQVDEKYLQGPEPKAPGTITSTTAGVSRLADLGVESRMDIVGARQKSDPRLLRITITNNGVQDVHILRYNTPLESSGSESLKVSVGNAKVKYVGSVARRPPPTDDDYLLVQAGSTVTAEYNISKNYRLEAAMSYTVELAAPWFDVKIGNDPRSIRMMHDCGTGIFQAPASGESLGTIASPLYTWANCSQSNIDQLARSQIGVGQAILPSIVSKHIVSGDALYTTWFGAYTTARANAISFNFTQEFGLWYALASEASGGGDIFYYDCAPPGCDPTWYAYVGGDCFDSAVCLCSKFWSGNWVDSQLQTMVHEASHDLDDTQDIVYGQAACKNLALTNPDSAIANADNYGYFAEALYGRVVAWEQAAMLPSWL